MHEHQNLRQVVVFEVGKIDVVSQEEAVQSLPAREAGEEVVKGDPVDVAMIPIHVENKVLHSHEHS